METKGLDIFNLANITRVFDVEAQIRFSSTAMQLLGLCGQLQSGSRYAPLGGIMELLYRETALQLMQRSGPSYIKNFIAAHGLGLPEF